jgi:hypothetical protein
MVNEEQIQQFIFVTNAPRHVAEHVIEAHNSDLDAAVNFYLESGGIGHGTNQPISPGDPPDSPPIIIGDQDVPIAPPRNDNQGGRQRVTSANPPLGTSRYRPGDEYDEDYGYGDHHVRPIPEAPGEFIIDDDDEEDWGGGQSQGRNRSTRRRRIRRNRPSGAAIIDQGLITIQQRLTSNTTNNGVVHSAIGTLNPDDTVTLTPDGGRRIVNTNEDDVFMAPSSQLIPSSHPVVGIEQEEEEEEEKPVPHLPDDVNLEEQRMLMSALTGEAYQGRIPDFTTDPRYQRQQQRQLSPGAQEREMLRQEQDAAYYESLALDQQKEAEQRAVEQQMEEEERLMARRRAEEKARREEEEQALVRRLSQKEASLPPEPNLGDSVVTILIRLPGGERLSRRFFKSHLISSIYDFVDISTKGKLADYNLVRQYPRRVLERGGEEGSGGGDRKAQTLADVDLTHSQEALFLELV